MSERKFEASKTVNDEKITAAVFKDFGDDLQDLVDNFGEDQVYNLAFSKLESKLKSAIRREIDAGTPPDAIPERLKSWSPNIKHKVAKNPEEEATQAFLQMSPEKQEEHLEKLRKKLAGS